MLHRPRQHRHSVPHIKTAVLLPLVGLLLGVMVMVVVALLVVPVVAKAWKLCLK